MLACQKIGELKATVHHIKQVAGDPQAVQTNLFRHQCTELPPSKYKKKKKSSVKHKLSNYKQHGSENYQAQTHHKKRFDPKSTHNNKDSSNRGMPMSSKKYQCKACHKFGHFTSLCFQKKQASSNLGDPKCISYKQVQYM